MLYPEADLDIVKAAETAFSYEGSLSVQDLMGSSSTELVAISRQLKQPVFVISHAVSVAHEEKCFLASKAKPLV